MHQLFFLDPDSGWYCFLQIFTQQQHSQPDSSVSWLVKLPVSNQQPAVSPTSSAQIPEYQYKSKGCFVFFVFLWLRETNICCCGMTTRFHLRAHISEQIRFPSDPLLFLTVLWVLIPFFPPAQKGHSCGPLAFRLYANKSTDPNPVIERSDLRCPAAPR